MYEIELDRLPPSVNHAYIIRNVKGRILRFRTARAQEYFKYVKRECFRQLNKVKILTHPISVHIEVSFRDKRKRDIDNLLKILLDSFEGVLWADDSQIFELYIKKSFDKNQKIRVKITPIPYGIQSQNTVKSYIDEENQ